MSRRGWWPVVVGVICVVAAVHAALVAPHYVVGSFDDDGHYLALAKAFAAGRGYVDTSAPGAPTESLFPPGYPTLLAPLVWIAPGVLWTLRLLSAAAFVGAIPLLDLLLRRRQMSAELRAAVLLLYALNPVAATFATEVMPESVFVLVFLIVLIALPRWEEEQRLVTWSGAAVALGTPCLFLLKTAAAMMVAGVVIWLALRRRWRQVATLAVTSAVLIGPVVIVRLLSGSLVGDRYTSEYQESLSFVSAVWHGVASYASYAFSATLVPTDGVNLLGHNPVLDAVLYALRYSAAALVALGWIAWLRARLDVSIVIIPLYLIETLPFPFINERRLILVLPWIAAWYVVGWATVLRAVRRWRPVATRTWASRTTVAVPAVAVVGLLLWQLPRDYLLRLGETTPSARGSGYVAALREMTPVGWSIATSFRWTISDLTGRTASNTADFTFTCPAPGQPGDVGTLHRMLLREHVATVLDAALKWPGWLESTCKLQTISAAPWAVTVYTGADKSTIHVLIGPGTPRPNLTVADNVIAPSALTRFGRPVPVREVSVELARSVPGAALELRDPAGRWLRLPTRSTQPAPVLLHAQLPRPVDATAVRVIGANDVWLSHLVVLGASR